MTTGADIPGRHNPRLWTTPDQTKRKLPRAHARVWNPSTKTPPPSPGAPRDSILSTRADKRRGCGVAVDKFGGCGQLVRLGREACCQDLGQVDWMAVGVLLDLGSAAEAVR